MASSDNDRFTFEIAHVPHFRNGLNEQLCCRFIFTNLQKSLRSLGKVWLEILVANLATNFQDLVAKVKSLVALAPVLGAILRPVQSSSRRNSSGRRLVLKPLTMLEDLLGPPIWQPESSVSIWNLLGLSSQLIFWTERKHIYTSTSPDTWTPKMAKNHEISVWFSTNLNLHVAFCHAPP